MNKKDIEKQLLNENSSIKVPDVFPNVKRAPLNKLLTGETPMQVFKKKFAIGMLALTTVLFIIVTIALAALILSPTPNEVAQSSNSYVSIVITKQDSSITKYGFVVDTNGNLLIAEKEEDGGLIVMQRLETKNNNIEDTIANVITPSLGDSVLISAQNTNSQVAFNLKNNALSGIKEVYGSTNYVVNTMTNDTQTIDHLVAMINSKSDKEVSASDNIGDLVGCYLSIC